MGRCRQATISILLVLISIFLLTGADGCPMTVAPDPAPSGTNTQAASEVDLGGNGGALWLVKFADKTLLTVKSPDGAQTVKVSSRGEAVTIEGNSVYLANFCWRTDVVCPQQLLQENTLIAQPAKPAGQVYLQISPKSAMVLKHTQGGILGTLEKNELFIPIQMANADKKNTCVLGDRSALVATASVDESPQKAEQLQGRVTLVYTAPCFNLTGSGQVHADTTVELAMEFEAQR